MKHSRIQPILAFLTVATFLESFGSPEILSFDADRRLVWTNSFSGGVATMEATRNLTEGPWSPYFYDLVTNTIRTTQLPPVVTPPVTSDFYRIAVRTNAPDPSLILHLPFDNDLATGTVVDISGHANHGTRYHPKYWPSPTTGPDGSQAAEFHVYDDGGRPGFHSGDYVAIAHTPALNNLKQATISAWAHYYATPQGSSDHTANIIDAQWSVSGSWMLGRYYSGNTRFVILGPNNSTVYAVRFPDETRTGDTGGWNHYSVTFDQGAIKGYYNGAQITSTNLPYSSLILGGRFICVSCWNHGGTPIWEDVDQLPNNAWMNGAIDDIRIYNRVLTSNEVFSIYSSTRTADAP